MAAFLVRAPLQQVHEHVLLVLEYEDFSISEGAATGTTPTIAAAKPSSRWWLGVEARIHLQAEEGTTLVTASFRPAMLAQIALLVPSVAFTVIVLIMSLYPDLFFAAAARVFLSIVAHFIVQVVSASDRTPLTELPTSYIVLASHVAALVPVYVAQLRVAGAISEVVPKVEAAFWKEMRSEFRARLVALAEFRALGRGHSASLTTGIMTAGGLLLFAVHPYVLLGALPLLICVWVAALLPLVGEDRPGLYARAISAVQSVRMILLNSLVLLLAVLGLTFTLAGQMEQRAGGDWGIRSVSALREYLDSGGPLLDEIRTGEERMRQLHERMSYWTGRIMERGTVAEEYRDFIEGSLIAALAIPAGACLWLLFHVGFLMWRTTGTSLVEEWRNHTTRVEVDWIRLPATIESRTLRSLPFRLGVGLLFVTGSVINGSALLIAVDSFSFALGDHVLLFWWVQPLLTWVFVPFKAVALFTDTAGWAVWDAAARAAIMAIAALPLIMCGRRVLGGCCRVAAQAGSVYSSLLRRNRIPLRLKHHMVELCDKHGLPAPRLRSLPSKLVSLVLVPSLVGLRSRLYVSAGALATFTEAELNAAVAHELGHVRQGNAWLRWLRLLSTLGGHPPWFLLLPVDLRSLEEEADQFALQVGAAPQALASAVVKASNPGGTILREGASLDAWLQTSVPDWVRRPISKIVQSAAVVDRFLFTDYLVSSPHPAIRDRLAAILAWVPEHQTPGQTGP